MGRDDRRSAGTGFRGVRPRLDRGAAGRLGPRGLRQPAVEDDGADRLRREGMGPRRLRADPRDGDRRRRRASTRAGPRASPASAGQPTGSKPPGGRPTPMPGRRRSVPPPAWRCASVPGVQAVRAQAPAQPDAARPRHRAIRAHRRLGLPADRSRASGSRSSTRSSTAIAASESWRPMPARDRLRTVCAELGRRRRSRRPRRHRDRCGGRDRGGGRAGVRGGRRPRACSGPRPGGGSTPRRPASRARVTRDRA